MSVFYCCFTACVCVAESRDRDDVTDSAQQPIYSRVNDREEDVDRVDDKDSVSSSSSPVPASAAPLSGGLPKYVHETPI